MKTYWFQVVQKMVVRKQVTALIMRYGLGEMAPS